ERAACVGSGHAGDIVLERVLAIEVLAFEALAEGPLPSWIVDPAGQAHPGPAAEGVADKADAGRIDERAPFGVLQDLVEGERHIARAVPQAVAAGDALIVGEGPGVRRGKDHVSGPDQLEGEP